MGGKLKRIIMHWTGGTWRANDVDRQHYHFIVQGDGTLVYGVHSVNDNLDCSDGNYAAHTGGGNTGSIGIALAGMWGDEYPIKRPQLEAFCKEVAKLCIRYEIPIDNTRVLTHAEWGERNPLTTSRGKPDINKLPCVGIYGVTECGNWLRSHINYYKQQLLASD